jgi:hypothetical protein
VHTIGHDSELVSTPRSGSGSPNKPVKTSLRTSRVVRPNLACRIVLIQARNVPLLPPDRQLMGHRVDGELIVDCPYCHRSAVRRTDDAVRFVHAIRIVKEGALTRLKIDSCPKVGPSPFATIALRTIAMSRETPLSKATNGLRVVSRLRLRSRLTARSCLRQIDAGNDSFLKTLPLRIRTVGCDTEEHYLLAVLLSHSPHVSTRAIQYPFGSI